jgi:hypothetical protein
MKRLIVSLFIIFIHLAYTQDQSVYNKQSQQLSRPEQEYVYHTNSNLWIGWDNYGNTADQTCSAIIPGWVYPGGSGLNYNCRAGYWIIANIDGTLYEGTTGQYDVSEGTEPGETSSGWAGSDEDYNKEPWITNTSWTIPEANLTVNAIRRSWSFQGIGYSYYKINDYDFNDFIIDEIQITNNGSSTIDEIVLGSKADHDITWNVPNPDWNYTFWTDDIVDYDEEAFLTMQLDGDNPGSAANDFGIDDPGRQYRGVRVGQAPLSIAGTNYNSLSQSDVNHMWWTGDEDPQTTESRHTMATMVSGAGDKKDVNPSPMDMRYLQSYSAGPIAPGETVTFIMAVVAGSGLENVKQAVFNARKAYDWEYNLPKPPSAPQMTNDPVEVLSDGSVKVSWSYTDDQISAIDPDKGVADFAGFRIYRSVNDSLNTANLFTEEDIIIESDANIDESTPYYPNQSGPFKLIADIPASDIGNYSVSSSGLYEWTDENIVPLKKHWYFVSAYDDAGTDEIHGSVPPLESYYTMCYPMVEAPDGSGGLIPGINMDGIIPHSEDQSLLSETVSGTLTLSESPYYVLNDVQTSGQVTIEPGVEIIFVNDVSLSGSFIAQGSEIDSIRFFNMNNQIDGVIINNGNSIFSYCAFDVATRTNGGSLSIEHSGSFTITAENTSIDITYSEPTLNAYTCTGNITNNSFDDFSAFDDCNDMFFGNNVFNNLIVISESNNITFKKNLFLGNSNPNNWSRVFWVIKDTSVTIINNTFSEFDMAAGSSESETSHIIGINDSGESLDIDIRNNIFWNISDTTNACVIRNYSGSDITIEYNNIQGGYDEIYGSFSLGPGNINEDPLFTDSENGDYTLQLGSPCIDTGDPDSPLDSDGTRADMGAFEAINDCLKPFNVLYPTVSDTFSSHIDSNTEIGFTWEGCNDVDGDITYRLTIELEFFGNTYTDTYDDIIDTSISITANNLDALLSGLNLEESIMYYYVQAYDEEYTVDSDTGQFVLSRSFLSTINNDVVPQVFALHQNHPNPFNPFTTLKYDLPEDALVNITIYDMMGRIVKTMVNSQQNAGFKSVQWNATNDAGSPVSAGLYLYMIQAGEFRKTKKMVLLK